MLVAERGSFFLAFGILCAIFWKADEVSSRRMKHNQTMSRDQRLDALRGLLLVIMAAVHVPTPVSHVLQEPFGFIGNAEGFFFLSACLAGRVYGNNYRKNGWEPMSQRL